MQRQLATYIGGTDDDAPRTFGRTIAQTRSLSKESSAPDYRGGAKDVKMAMRQCD